MEKIEFRTEPIMSKRLWHDILIKNMRKRFESPIYRRNRIAARLILKARAGGVLKERERRLARQLARDAAITSRLINQAINALCRKT
jgi:hypothetical protein